MALLILGIVIFMTIHLFSATPLRASLVGNIGEKPFKGGFALVSFLGLGLIIYGYSQADFHALWAPPAWARSLLIGLMPIVTILWVVAETPNNIKGKVRHPMLIGMILWGLGHLTANGDLASTLIFASFAAYSLLNIFMVNARNTYEAPKPVSRKWDAGVVVGGLILFLLLYNFHGSFTGMPIR